MINTMPPFVALTGVSKSFVPGRPVLDNVTLEFRRGEIHAIVGENGAGKSTLMNILFGLHQPDEGGILVEGRQVLHRSPADAIASRFAMVHQHFKLVPTFTVAENVRLGAPRAVRGTLRLDRDIAAIAEQYGIAIDPSAVVATLPLAIQQRIEILKALVYGADLLLLDEPTTILNPAEIVALYAVLKRIAAEGRAVVVVTHHLDEVLDHAGRVSVIRAGKRISSGAVGTTSSANLVREIVGRAVDLASPLIGSGAAPGAAELRLEHVSVSPSPSSSGLQDVSLELRAGEIVGIAGVEGNGQRDLFELLAGLRPPEAGTVWARRVDAAGRPQMGLVPEDRHHEGLVLDLPIATNLLLDRLGDAPFSRGGRLRPAAIAGKATEMLAASDIRGGGIHATPRMLSGGNQQKIVLARAMNEDRAVVVVYQPTRGLDVAASEEVLKRLRRSADEGRAVLIISSNLQEILRISDRTLVLYAGSIAGELARDEASYDAIGVLMTGGRPASATEGVAA